MARPIRAAPCSWAFLLLFGLLLSCAGAARALPGHGDEAAVGPTVRLLAQYLAIDTTNPPGNEMTTARFLQGIIASAGLETRLFDLGNGRANLYARLPGDGSRRPVVLLHHMDVVPADTRFWTVPPFSGRLAGGRLYGRGAIDMKTMGIVELQAMLELARSGKRLPRDLIYLAVADEEEGSLGAKAFLRDHADLVRDAEFLINEGQTILADGQGRVKRYLVAVGEKTNLWLDLVFRGPTGHGSLPLAGSAIERLGQAAERLRARPPGFRVSPAIRDYLDLLLADVDVTRLPGHQADLGSSLANPLFLRAIAANPRIRASLQDTISLTRLRAGDKINTIPNEAVLGLDCRLLPGTDPGRFLADLRRLLRDLDVEIRVVDTPAVATTSFSPADSAFMNALRETAARFDPGVPVTPVLLLSTTDSVFFRAQGIHCYGFEPYALTEAEYDLAHGNDESFPVAQLDRAVARLVDLLSRL
ncbi:MAG: M20/M25/M40 family metallo-hydrolase [Candidatus Riflebacteria bacterium]|nr:M20/M25/M40 family metallo-hydrolase [Candidatus Riflebacteria bacterium]